MDNEYNEYGENPFDDMMADYDYQVNTDDLPELFAEQSVRYLFSYRKQGSGMDNQFLEFIKKVQ